MSRNCRTQFVVQAGIRRARLIGTTHVYERVTLKYHHGKIVGRSKSLKKVLSEAERVAETDAPLLLLGETGTGKALLAETIHEVSTRKGRPTVVVNCASLAATLIESELFGRAAGAYTGAASAQVGRFDLANGSTLFLDEIGEFPIELQAKLLRVLQQTGWRIRGAGGAAEILGVKPTTLESRMAKLGTVREKRNSDGS